MITASGTALQQMYNFVAIAETKNPNECLRQLILHTLLTFDNERVFSAQDVAPILETMFGVNAPNDQIQGALDQLMSDRQVERPLGTSYIIAPKAKMEIKARINEASQLEDRVRSQWQAELIE